MNLGISLKYAWRSLVRHPRRTILSIAGIGLGCGLGLFIIGWVGGERKMMQRAAAQSGVGHLRIAPKEWRETRDNDLRLPNWQHARQTVLGMPNVKAATPHARLEGLLGFGTRTAAVELLGVDPETEPLTNRLLTRLEGDYLEPGSMGTAVVGATIAERLNVELGDDLLVTVSDVDGQMRSAMLRIVALVRTGSRDLDASICHVTLAQLGELSRQPGAAELTVFLHDADDLARRTADIKAALADDDYEILTWVELMPELASGVEIDEVFSRVTIGVLMLVVFLGIASAQLAAVLERRREFAVLAALGMKGRRLIMIMVLEGVILGLAGSLAALAVGVPSTWYVATFGVDFAALTQNPDLTMSNVLFEPIFYGEFGLWLIPYAIALALTATILSSLYPAWFAIRTDPAKALRVEQ